MITAGHFGETSRVTLQELSDIAKEQEDVWADGPRIAKLLRRSLSLYFQESKYGKLTFQVLSNKALDDVTRALMIADYVEAWSTEENSLRLANDEYQQ